MKTVKNAYSTSALIGLGILGSWIVWDQLKRHNSRMAEQLVDEEKDRSDGENGHLLNYPLSQTLVRIISNGLIIYLASQPRAARRIRQILNSLKTVDMEKYLSLLDEGKFSWQQSMRAIEHYIMTLGQYTKSDWAKIKKGTRISLQ